MLPGRGNVRPWDKMGGGQLLATPPPGSVGKAGEQNHGEGNSGGGSPPSLTLPRLAHNTWKHFNNIYTIKKEHRYLINYYIIKKNIPICTNIRSFFPITVHHASNYSDSNSTDNVITVAREMRAWPSAAATTTSLTLSGRRQTADTLQVSLSTAVVSQSTSSVFLCVNLLLGMHHRHLAAP